MRVRRSRRDAARRRPARAPARTTMPGFGSLSNSPSARSQRIAVGERRRDRSRAAKRCSASGIRAGLAPRRLRRRRDRARLALASLAAVERALQQLARRARRAPARESRSSRSCTRRRRCRRAPSAAAGTACRPARAPTLRSGSKCARIFSGRSSRSAQVALPADAPAPPALRLQQEHVVASRNAARRRRRRSRS